MHNSLLVVEDDVDQLEVLKLFLTRSGYDVVGVPHPQDALDAACDREFQVVILDQWLPEMEGLELMQRLRMLLDNAQYIVITGDDHLVDEAKKAGAFACLLKPYRLSLIETVIEEALERRVNHIPQRAEDTATVSLTH
ncbi:MAG: response regulator [Planctomycetaceae bacterium]